MVGMKYTVNPIQGGIFFKPERVGGGHMARWYFLLIWSPKKFCTAFQNISYFLTILRMSTEKIRHFSLKMSPGEQNMYKLYFPDFLECLTCWEFLLYEKLDSWTSNRHKKISDEDSTVNLFVNSIWNLNLKSHAFWW